MPVEMRYILFSEYEIFTALYDFYRRRNASLPSGSLSRLSYTQVGSQWETLIEINRSDGGGKYTKRVVQEELMASLILFCSNNSIPLPQKHYRSLEKIGDNLTLYLSSKAQAVGVHHLLTGT